MRSFIYNFSYSLRSLLEEQSILSKQSKIFMKNNEANRAELRGQGEHFQREIREIGPNLILL